MAKAQKSVAQQRLDDAIKERAAARAAAMNADIGPARFIPWALVGLMVLAMFNGWHPWSVFGDMMQQVANNAGHMGQASQEEQGAAAIGMMVSCSLNIALPIFVLHFAFRWAGKQKADFIESSRSHQWRELDKELSQKVEMAKEALEIEKTAKGAMTRSESLREPGEEAPAKRPMRL
jgi:hypothetical protein